ALYFFSKIGSSSAQCLILIWSAVMCSHFSSGWLKRRIGILQAGLGRRRLPYLLRAVGPVTTVLEVARDALGLERERGKGRRAVDAVTPFGDPVQVDTNLAVGLRHHPVCLCDLRVATAVRDQQVTKWRQEGRRPWLEVAGTHEDDIDVQLARSVKVHLPQAQADALRAHP